MTSQQDEAGSLARMLGVTLEEMPTASHSVSSEGQVYSRLYSVACDSALASFQCTPSGQEGVDVSSAPTE